MDKLVTLEEVQALVALFSKTPMTPAEQLWAQALANRLFNYAQPSRPQPKQPNPDVDPFEVDLNTKQPGPDAT